MSEQEIRPVNPLRENPEGIFAFQWHITDNCDQRCRHCYIFAENREKPLVSMRFDQMREVLRKCDEFTAKLDMHPLFYITGGDPILHPDFWKLAELMKEQKRPFAMMGNPFHLSEEVCKRLKDCGCAAYQLSVDGLEETHDWFRMPGSYKKTMETIRVISRAGIEATVMMTVSEKNCRELPAVMDAVVEAGADSFGFARYVPTSEEKHNLIPPMEYRALLDTYVKKRREHFIRGSFTKFTLKDHLLALYFYEEGNFHPPAYCHKEGDHMPAGCHCANGNAAILPDGTFMACRRADGSALGNIFTDDMMEMWDKAKKTYRQYDKYTGCSRCKLSPWCRGCPAVAYGTTGDYFSGDPQCWHVVEE